MTQNHHSLIICLQHLTSVYGQVKSFDALMAGVPVSGHAVSSQPLDSAGDKLQLGSHGTSQEIPASAGMTKTKPEEIPDQDRDDNVSTLTPDQFKIAAINAKIRTQIAEKSFQSLNNDLCPLILLLNDDKAVVLHKIEGDTLEIFDPEDGERKTVISYDIKNNYAGSVILTQKFTERRRHARHWFWGMIRDNKPIYQKVGVAALLINLFGLVGPLFIMNVYDRVIPNNAFETGWVLAIGALTVFGFDFVMRTLRGYYIDLAGRKIDVIVGRRIYDQLLSMKLIHRPQSSGAFANMLREFEGVKDFCTSASLTAIIDLPFSLLFILVIYLLAGNIALILLVIMGLVALSGYLLQFPLKKLIKDSMHAAEAKHGLLVETINGLETVKLARADSLMRGQYEEHLGESAEVNQASRFFSGLAVNIATLLQQSTSIIIVLFGMYMIEDGTMTMGALIAAVILGGKAIAPVGQIAALMSRIHTVRGSLETLDKFMAMEVERPKDKNYLNRSDLKGAIRLDRVSFAYPREGRKILDGVSFEIKEGEKVGIIGRIGSGKSTLTKIMAGLYDPAEGDLFIDGTDLRQIDPADLRRTIGYIAQDTVLFRGSVRDNIVIGRPQATDADVLTVAQLTGVHDFISKHPMGYDAPVGERGDGLSGGQKQCVALARALIADPQILLADEPTNHMDIQAEAAFVTNIEKLATDKTLVLITHRQNLLQLVDRLILIEQGKVLADGPRDKVLKALQGGGKDGE